MSQKELLDLLSKARSEIDETRDRLKTHRARLGRMVEEITADIEALTELQEEIEKLPHFQKDNGKPAASVDEIDAFKKSVAIAREGA